MADKFQSPYVGKKGKMLFVFNPHPIESKTGGCVTGYCSELDIPEIKAGFGAEIFKQVRFSHTIKENGIYPAYFPEAKGETLHEALLRSGIDTDKI
jgi:hypothetical protein